jgi:hypothetical protein
MNKTPQVRLYPRGDIASEPIRAPRSARASTGSLWFLAVCGACCLAGCRAVSGTRGAPSLPSGSQIQTVREELDEQTGTRLVIVKRPIVLSRARTDVAANVRDYATLVALQEDEAGHFTTWLVVHEWSTVDPRLSNAGWIGDGSLVLIADGREIALAPAADGDVPLSHRDWIFWPVAPLRASFAYRIDIATLRYLVAAHQLTVRFQGDPLPLRYEMWRDGRDALRLWLAEAEDSPLN